jgi:heme exporter protein B
VLLAVLWKDLVTEWRHRDRVVAMLLFSLLVVVIFDFSLPDAAPGAARGDLPGLLWMAYLFTSLLGLNRAFALELENEALSGLALAPADRGWIFLGKATANLVFLLAVQGVTAVVFAAVFRAPLAGIAGPLAGVVVLGSVGLCSLGTLFAAIAVRTRYREVMLPLLLLPLLVPLLVASVQATASLLAEGRPGFGPIQLLLVTDGVFLIVSFLGFDYVLDE